MSRENVEVVRRMLDDWVRGDFDRALSAFADDVEWVTVFGERFHGPEGVAASVRRFTGTWADYTLEIEELIDVGDAVVVVFRHGGRGKGSGAPVEMTMSWLYVLRAGTIGEVRMFVDRESALAAAGSPSEPD